MRWAWAAVAVVLVGSIPGGAIAQGSFGAIKDAATTAERGVRRAIVVGINDYDDPAFASLRFAAKDAEDVAGVLSDSRYGGFASVEVVVDGDLTAAGIVGRLEAWSKTLGPDDLAVVYLSGHGTRWLDEKDRSHVYLATSDTKRAYPLVTSLPMDALKEFVDTLPTMRRVLIVDACFTGDGKAPAADQAAAASALVDEVMPFPSRAQDGEAHLFATTYGRPAAELAELQNGAYTHHLLLALTERFDEADLNGDQVVSVSEAHDWARDATMQATSELQVPMIQYRIIGRETLILSGDPGSRERAQLAMVTSYEGPQQGLRLFVDGEEKGAFPRTVLVEPGSHQIEFQNLAGKVVDRGKVRFKAEGVYSVAKLRDDLNGGRHLLSVGYAHTWFPGAQWKTPTVPHGPGFRIAYDFRFPSRSPVVRRMGLFADVSMAFFASRESLLEVDHVRQEAPRTTLLDVGVGYRFRFELGPVSLQLGLRAAVMALLREEYRLPWVHWLLGGVGGDAMVGVRPVKGLSIQVRYQPTATLADLHLVTADGEPPPMWWVHRLVGGIEVGF